VGKTLKAAIVRGGGNLEIAIKIGERPRGEE
jgi:hypothetical protein